MHLSVGLDEGRAAFTESVEAFLAAVDGLAEYDLLAGSRCHGWTRHEVLVHVLAGWQEMLGGLVSRVEDAPTVDAASYWTAFKEQYADADLVDVLMSQRRRGAAYARPGAARQQLHDVAEAVLRGVAAMPDAPCLWDKHVFDAGDFLAVWAVEDVVHHLDLQVATAAPSAALALARATIESLAGTPLPGEWSDEEAALKGTGRTPVGDGPLAGVLPVLG